MLPSGDHLVDGAGGDRLLRHAEDDGRLWRLGDRLPPAALTALMPRPPSPPMPVRMMPHSVAAHRLGALDSMRSTDGT